MLAFTAISAGVAKAFLVRLFGLIEHHPGCSAVRFWFPVLLIFMVWLNVIGLTRDVLAQSPAGDEKESAPPDGGSPRVSERELETYYLEREDGTLKPFFNIPFEEWDELYKFYKGLKKPDQPPRFLLRSVRITGDVRGDFAYLNVTAKAVVQSDDWVRIPLKMNQGLLLPDSEENARGNSLLEYDEDNGLVWRVKGKVGQQHSLSIQICSKLRRLGEQTHLELSIPKATTSRLQLVVPEAGIEAVANDSAYLLNSISIGGDKTRVSVDGIGGQLRLVWQKRMTQLDVTSIFNTNADVRIRFESQQLRADASLRLNVSSGEIKSFIVQMPPKMRRIPVEQRGFEVKTLLPSDPRLKGAPPDCEHLEFSLDHASTSPIDVSIAGQRALQRSEVGQLVEVAGFKVFGAVSQTGTLSLAADPDWAFRWSHDSAVEQVEDLPDTRLRQGVVASFIFTSQPYAFRVAMSRKEQRVHVDPRYELTIERDRVLLAGVISYRLRGAVTQAVTLDCSGWQLKGVAIDDQNVFETELPEASQPIRVPLGKLDQSLVRDFDLTLSAELYLPPSGTLAALLPELEATSQTPAEVIVRHADNIEVVPLLDQFKGLTKFEDTSAAVPGTLSSDSVAYRGWAKPDRLVFAAQVGLRPPEVVVTTDGKVTLEREWVKVRQDMTYRVLFQSVPQLLLKLPTAIARDEGLQLSLDNEETQWKEVSQDEGYSVLGVALKAQRPGPVELAISYRLAVNQVHDSEENRFSIPLAVPFFDGVGRVSETMLTVEDYDGRDFRTDDVWTSTATTAVDGVQTMQLRSAAPAPVETLKLNVSSRPLLSLRDSVVDVAWLQTWLTESRRSDRLAVRLTTRRDQVRFRLPMSATLEDVALDKRQVTQQVVDEAGDVVVKLPPDGNGGSRIVELWYFLPRNDDVLDIPQLIDADWTRRFYWQLVLPRDEHLLLGPKELNSEASWNWRMPIFGRTPRFDQRALEQIVGASEQLPLPESANKYLFSSQGAVARVQITTADRAGILLVAGVIVFVVGLLLIYLPSLRHPASLLMFCVALCVIGLWFPDPTIQFAQLSTIGLLFVLLAFTIKRLLARTRRGPAILHGTSLSSIESSVTESMLARSEGSAVTATHALVPQTSESASRP